MWYALLTEAKPDAQQDLQRGEESAEGVVREARVEVALARPPVVGEDGRQLRVDAPEEEREDDLAREDPDEEEDAESHVGGLCSSGVVEELGEL